MHIAYWAPAWPLEKFQNGVVSYVHWMKHEMERRGHRVSVLTNHLDVNSTSPDVYLVRRSLWDRGRNRIPGMWRSPDARIFDFSRAISTALSQIHRRSPIDVIEMEESFGWFAEIAERTSIPLLVKLHGPAFLSLVEKEIDSTPGQARIREEGVALAKANSIAGVSRRIMAQTIERYALKPTIAEHIVLPVPTTENIPIWHQKECDAKTILFVGRVDLRKGADIMLKAFKKLLENRPTLRLVVVGPDGLIGDSETGLLGFHEYCASLFPHSLRHQIDYRGRLPFNEILALRTRAIATVVASRWENQPYTVLEAMLQGVPVVSTDAGGCGELIAHGVTGRLARSGDPDDFCHQIEKILDHPDDAAAMGRAAREYVLREHSAAKIADESLALFSKIITQAAK